MTVGPFGDLSLKPICPPGYLNPCIAIVALAGFVLEDRQFGFHWSHKSCLEMRAFRNIIYDRGSDKYTCCDILKSYPQGTDITVPYPKLICFSGKWKQRKMHARAALPYLLPVGRRPDTSSACGRLMKDSMISTVALF